MESTMTNKTLKDATFSDVIAWYKEGANLYMSNFVVLFVATLLASLLGVFSLFVLAGPLFAGVLAMYLRLQRGDTEVGITDVFAKMDRFLDTFLLMLCAIVVSLVGQTVLGLIPGIGDLLGFLLSAAITPVIGLALILAVDRGLGVQDAAKEAVALFQENPIMLVVFGVVATLLTIVGVALFIVGMFFVMPILPGAMASLYSSHVNGTSTVRAEATSSEDKEKVVVGEQ